ncbi:helix-turn-helix domain-containing protein [Cereibacter sp. SYSU M97828]|nr:helix-turn-helix domain-containing protein [Cereibacter flavus]
MAELPPLDQWRLDGMLELQKMDSQLGPRDKLWGLEAIAAAMGVSAKTARRWADDGKAPSTKPAGRYFARRSELNAWLRSK